MYWHDRGEQNHLKIHHGNAMIYNLYLVIAAYCASRNEYIIELLQLLFMIRR
jgi:hypothetical protein